SHPDALLVLTKGSLPFIRTWDHPCRNRLPGLVAEFPLIGDEVGVFAVYQLIAMSFDRIFSLIH
ncbi:hypothetical protein, partial [Bradyrhizobium sp.]|uniref:hypothetical protein n=1 Tax=Bradyrhizobium sp. TaxID=376 RepID=UPI003C3BCD95